MAAKKTKKKAAKRGQPTKLTKERREKILKLISFGNFKETACAAAGIDSRTLRIWLKKGAEGVPIYAKFALEMEEAEAMAESGLALKVARAATVDWRAAAWALARKWPNRWGEKLQLDVQMELRERLEEVLKIVREEVDPEAAARIFKRLAG